MLYVGHPPQQTAEIMQQKNKGLVTQNETFGIINTVHFLNDKYSHTFQETILKKSENKYC